MTLRDHHGSATLAYLDRLYDPSRRMHAFDGTTRQAHEAWSAAARPALMRLLGLEQLEAERDGFVPSVALGEAEPQEGYTRSKGLLLAEPDVSVPFWMLVPGGAGPFPLAILPHGHYQEHGLDYAVGIAHSLEMRERIAAEDRDVAVQAVRRGFVALAPACRGFAPVAVPDLTNRHDRRDYRSQMIHAVLAGRTAIGERVWDVMRLIDWAGTQAHIDLSTVLVMGNSGGGMTTLYAPACDPRITVAVASCSFCTIAGRNGAIHHCDCNLVPGLLRFGELADVAGLIAPRRLLVVHGRTDPLFPLDEIARAVNATRLIFRAAGTDGAFAHAWGEAGHRFYSDRMWPFVGTSTGAASC